MPTYINKPTLSSDELNRGIVLPYGVTPAGILLSIDDVYSYLNAVNRASIEHGYDRLEDFAQPAGFSGLLSHLFVRSLARQFSNATPGLAVNQFPNGRPDLVPRAHYADDRVLQGDHGIEVKVSRARSGWQGHNPESGWLLIVQVDIDAQTAPVHERRPTSVTRVMIARLDASDWNFSGRGVGSRRTPTASVNASGLAKLERGTVYSRR